MEEMKDFMWKHLGVPYVWTGNTPRGWDCSGAACEFLKTFGELPLGADMNSQMLFDYYSKGLAEWNSYKRGALIFFGKSAAQITHVAVLLNEFMMWESAGGDSSCLSVEDAIKRNAFTRFRPIASRHDTFKGVLRPRYRAIGLI